MSDQHGFQVDVQAVHAFGTDFQRDLDLHLSSETVQTLHIFSETPLFGARALSDDVKQAAKNYHARLVEIYDILDALLYNGAVMARAAHAIADAYTTADTVTDREVQKAVSDARRAVIGNAAAVDPETGRPI